MRMIIVFATVLLATLVSCSKEPLQLGSDIRDGKISKKSLHYSFHAYQGGATIQDLINFLYFEGDTLCFSLKVEAGYSEKQVAAWIIDPVTQRESRIERLDFYPDKVTGFSLVGSVLEDFQKDRLQQPVPPDRFCCKDIPIIVKVKVGAKTFIRHGTFRLEYR